MAWIYLFIAGAFEIVWTISMKYTKGFTKFWPLAKRDHSIGHGFQSFSSITSIENLAVGTAYAVWTGIGAAGTAILGILLFGESREIGRLVCIILIVAGIVGLKLTSSH